MKLFKVITYQQFTLKLFIDTSIHEMSQEKTFMVLTLSFLLVLYVQQDPFVEILSWDRVVCCNILRFMTQKVNKEHGMKKFDRHFHCLEIAVKLDLSQYVLTLAMMSNI